MLLVLKMLRSVLTIFLQQQDHTGAILYVMYDRQMD